jgi:Putative metal-binding motif
VSLPTDRRCSLLRVIWLAAFSTGCEERSVREAHDGGGTGEPAIEAGAPDGCLTFYPDDDGDGVGHGDPVCAQRLAPGLAEFAGDCEPTDSDRAYVHYRDADGDGYGDETQSICAGKAMLDGFVRASLIVDCDDRDPLRRPSTYERFGDGIDSDCDEVDDPTLATEPCSCAWLAAPASLQVETACEQGFDPEAAAAALATLDLADPTCDRSADLALELAAQCASECSTGPVYFAVANRGSSPSTETVVSIEGKFRASPPRVPLLISALAPGARSALIEVQATGGFTIRVEPQPDECRLDDNELALDVIDFHCGFFP